MELAVAALKEVESDKVYRLMDTMASKTAQLMHSRRDRVWSAASFWMLF
jgi:hypothetical protein